MKPQETVDYNIKHSWHAISRMYNAVAVKHGMTMSIGYVLINVDGTEGTPATHIAPKLGLEVRSLTRTLKNMETEGLIYRQSDLSDGRMVRIHLTAEGRRKREIARQAVRAFNFRIREHIDPGQLATFFEVINKISRIVEENVLPVKATPPLT